MSAWRARAAAAALGLAASTRLPEPPLPVHPVARFGPVMAAVERAGYADRRGAGVRHAAVGVAVAAAAGRLLRAGLGPVAATAVAVEVAAAPRMLHDEAARIAAHLAAGDLDAARAALPALAGRDPSVLDEEGVARAVVESVAENTVDAVVATGWWGALGGAAGALGHRAANTLDAMVGHRTARYARFGWASARLDDAAAWVPARVTALLVAVVRPASAGAVWQAVRTQAPAHPSPNAGVAEAAFAAALGLRLGGVNRYGDTVEARAPLGTGRAPRAEDVARAVRLSRDVTAALVAALAAPAAVEVVRRAARRSCR